MDSRTRKKAWFLLVLFALFFCGNTFFVHSHQLIDGHVEVHSHPYMPGSHHTHSDAGFLGIAQLNAAMASMELSAPIAVPGVRMQRVRQEFRLRTWHKYDFTDIGSGRAPPVAA